LGKVIRNNLYFISLLYSIDLFNYGINELYDGKNFLDDAIKNFSIAGIFSRVEKFTTAYENFLDDAIKNFSIAGIFFRVEKFTTAYENFLVDTIKNFSIA